MPSFPHDGQAMIARKVELLETMTACYASAMDALVDSDLDAASLAVGEAAPILAELSANERDLERAGVPTPHDVSTKTEGVRVLHHRLLTVLEEGMEEVRGERARLSKTKNFHRSVFGGAGDQSGTLIDGTC